MPTLNFKGRTFVQNHHLAVEYHQLVPKKKLSQTDKLSLHDNLIIHGDNLKALKALLPIYAGKVKCIYIDPPYNTGNEGWAYNDNVNSPMIREWLGKVVDKDDLTRRDKWLCMMMPRLKLLHELLAEDGVIFISIDDNEQHRLMMLMDEIFGEDNFSTIFVWEKKKKPSFLHKNVGNINDFIVCYLKNKEYAFPFSIETTTEGKKYPLNNAGNEEKILTFPEASVTFNCKDGIIKPQDMSEANIKTHLLDEVIIEKGGNKNRFRLRGEWRYSQKKLNEIIAQGDEIRISKIPFRPNHIKRGGEIKKMKNTLSPHHYSIPTNEDATKDIIEIFGGVIFENTKPVNLIKSLVKAVSYNNKDCLILDSFAGSGTTAHAVLDLNKQDGGNRKFILVEMEDHASSITAERIRRIIKGVPKSKNFKEGTGGTFSYFELGEPVKMESILRGDRLPSYGELARYVFYTATGEEFNPDKIKEEKNFIGSSKDYEVYLFYKPDIEYLKSTALTLERARSLGAYNGKRRLVFAPAKFVDIHTLLELRIDFCQLPFEIYKLKG